MKPDISKARERADRAEWCEQNAHFDVSSGPTKNELVTIIRQCADEIDRSHEFIREIAWRFSDHAAANWSGPDVLANIADFFSITVKELDAKMEAVR